MYYVVDAELDGKMKQEGRRKVGNSWNDLVLVSRIRCTSAENWTLSNDGNLNENKTRIWNWRISASIVACFYCSDSLLWDVFCSHEGVNGGCVLCLYVSLLYFSVNFVILCLPSILWIFDTVGWVFWPVKTVSHTYTVLAGM